MGYFLYIVGGIYIICSLFSCNMEKANLRRDLLSLQSKAIELPINRMHAITYDSNFVVSNFTSSNLKVVVYHDSTACATCAVDKIFIWERYIQATSKFQGKIKFYFIFFTKCKEDMKELRRIVFADKFNYPIFLDTIGIFERENPHLPLRASMHTFILDKDNKVILVGDPLNNHKLDSLYRFVFDKYLFTKP